MKTKNAWTYCRNVQICCDNKYTKKILIVKLLYNKVYSNDMFEVYIEID